jgi:hypothetical protein
MNRKFEQDGLVSITKFFTSDQDRPRPTNPVVLESWIDETGNKSVWARKDEELHLKVQAEYSN